MIRQRGYFEPNPAILVEDESFELFEARYRTETLP